MGEREGQGMAFQASCPTPHPRYQASHVGGTKTGKGLIIRGLNMGGQVTSTSRFFIFEKVFAR